MKTFTKNIMPALMVAGVAMSTVVFGRGWYRQDVNDLININTSYPYLEQYCTYDVAQEKFADCEGTYGIYEERIVPKVQNIVQRLVNDSPNADVVAATIESLDSKLVALKNRSSLTRTKFLIELIQQEFALFVRYYNDVAMCDDPLLSQILDCTSGGNNGGTNGGNNGGNTGNGGVWSSAHDFLIRRVDNYQAGSQYKMPLTSREIALPVYVGYISNATNQPIAIEEIDFDYVLSGLHGLDGGDFTMHFGRKATDDASSSDCNLQYSTHSSYGLEFPLYADIQAGERMDFCVVLEMSEAHLPPAGYGSIEVSFRDIEAETVHDGDDAIPLIMSYPSVREVESRANHVSTSNGGNNGWSNTNGGVSTSIQSWDVRLVRRDSYQRTSAYPRIIEGQQDWLHGDKIPVYIASVENNSNTPVFVDEMVFDYSASTNLDIDMSNFILRYGLKSAPNAADCTLWFQENGYGDGIGMNDLVGFDTSSPGQRYTIQPGERMDICVLADNYQWMIVGSDRGEFNVQLDNFKVVDATTSAIVQGDVFENFSVREVGRATFSVRTDSVGNIPIIFDQNDAGQWTRSDAASKVVWSVLVRNNTDERITVTSFDLSLMDMWAVMGTNRMTSQHDMFMRTFELHGVHSVMTDIDPLARVKSVAVDLVLEPGEEKRLLIGFGMRWGYTMRQGAQLNFSLSDIVGVNDAGDIKQGSLWYGTFINDVRVD